MTRACVLLALLIPAAMAEALRFSPVTPDVVRARMDRLRDNNQERAAELRAMFEESGCKGEHLVQAAAKGARSNVVCTLPGDSDERIIVGAHFDKVAKSEGAIDDWSGTSLLPSVYEALSKLPKRRYTWVFVGFAEEETGLNGSKAFVKQLGKDGAAKVHAMINLECLGLSPTKIWVKRSDTRLIRAAAALGRALKLDVSGVDVDAVGDSDSRPFAEAKIPVLDLHSVTQETLPLLHTPNDKRSAIRDENHYESYRLVTALTAWLDANFSRHEASTAAN